MAIVLPQQTGVLFIIRQQLQPASQRAVKQSQQPWIMEQHLASPEVQVMTQPSLVTSQVHMPMVMLQQQTVMPFIMQQQVQRPFCSIMHRFCIIPQATVSSQTQWIFMPPVHFSNRIVQRGTIK